MQIDPKCLKAVTEQDLIREGAEPHIAKVRAEHLHETRAKRIETLENTIKSGMLGQMAHAMKAVKGGSPTALKSHITGPAKYTGSESRCDIPLREPLDPEYRLNRKLAK